VARVVAIIALWLVPLASPADAATYTVNPVQIFMSESSRSALLSVHNASAEPLRLHVTAFRWDEGLDGDMRLAPTAEVVFFPRLLTIEPGGERKIRVAVTGAAGAVERAFRLFLEELPPVATTRSSAGRTVRLLTRTGVPIFATPPQPLRDGGISAVTADSRGVSFEIRNTGTAHFVVQAVKVTALGATGTPLFDREVPGWYVLAGQARRYAFALPANVCAGARTVLVEARTAQRTFTARIATEAAGCPG
jgi:fimbrial chaperone protein